MDVKDLEYKNMDDETAAGTGTNESEEDVLAFEEGEDVGGVIFATLAKRHDALGRRDAASWRPSRRDDASSPTLQHASVVVSRTSLAGIPT